MYLTGFADEAAGGYDGGIAIEPHIEVVFHDDNAVSSDQSRRDYYIQYGRRLTRLLKECKEEAEP